MANSKRNKKMIYHAHIPFDRVKREAFVPFELLESKSEEDKKVFIATLAQKLVVDLMALDVQPRIIMKETPRRQKMQDGIVRDGLSIELSVLVGKMPLVQGANGQSILDSDDTKQIITVGNN